MVVSRVFDIPVLDSIHQISTVIFVVKIIMILILTILEFIKNLPIDATKNFKIDK